MITAAQARQAQSQAQSRSNAAKAVHVFAADLPGEQLSAVILAAIEARPEITGEELTKLAQAIGGLGWERSRRNAP